MDLDARIRVVPDFPVPGIPFRDVTPLLADPEALAFATRQMVRPFGSEPVDLVAGIDARGFIFGTLVARELGVGFVPLRKPGKLPYQTFSEAYVTEYSTDTLAIHVDAVPEAARVLVADDVLATGGTAAAACALVERAGGVVAGCTFLLELTALSGRAKLAGRQVHAVLAY